MRGGVSPRHRVQPPMGWLTRAGRLRPPVGVALPERHRALVGLAVQRHARTALVHAQRVAHHGDRRHRHFVRLGGVDAADDAPVGVDRRAFLAPAVRRCTGSPPGSSRAATPRPRTSAPAPAVRCGCAPRSALCSWWRLASVIGTVRQRVRGPVFVDEQLAERRVAVEHLARRVRVEVRLELLGGAVLDGVAAGSRGNRRGRANSVRTMDMGNAAARTGAQGNRSTRRPIPGYAHLLHLHRDEAI